VAIALVERGSEAGAMWRRGVVAGSGGGTYLGVGCPGYWIDFVLKIYMSK
jgi:hypothetical protein